MRSLIFIRRHVNNYLPFFLFFTYQIHACTLIFTKLLFISCFTPHLILKMSLKVYLPHTLAHIKHLLLCCKKKYEAINHSEVKRHVTANSVTSFHKLKFRVTHTNFKMHNEYVDGLNAMRMYNC